MSTTDCSDSSSATLRISGLCSPGDGIPEPTRIGPITATLKHSDSRLSQRAWKMDNGEKEKKLGTKKKKRERRRGCLESQRSTRHFSYWPHYSWEVCLVADPVSPISAVSRHSTVSRPRVVSPFHPSILSFPPVSVPNPSSLLFPPTSPCVISINIFYLILILFITIIIYYSSPDTLSLLSRLLPVFCLVCLYFLPV